MSDATFQTFLTSGLLVLTASIGYLAWSAWRWIDRARDMEKAALVGVGYELRMNLTRMINELAGVESGAVTSEIQLVPVVHPQLDGVLSRPNEADRESLTMMLGNYNELSAHKQTLRAALGGQGDVAAAANVGVDAVIGSIATLYLWEEHKGCPPDSARGIRGSGPRPSRARRAPSRSARTSRRRSCASPARPPPARAGRAAPRSARGRCPSPRAGSTG